MTTEKAIEIIEIYHNSIKDLRPEAIVQSNGVLRYSSGMIKYAHFVFVSGVIEAGNLTDETAKMYMESYALIDSLFVDPDDVESINLQYREYVLGLKNGIITDFQLPNYGGELNASMEFEEFMNEYLWRLGKPKITENSNRAFMINYMTKKYKAEKDTNSLLQLVNEGRIFFPNKNG